MKIKFESFKIGKIKINRSRSLILLIYYIIFWYLPSFDKSMLTNYIIWGLHGYIILLVGGVLTFNFISKHWGD